MRLISPLLIVLSSHPASAFTKPGTLLPSNLQELRSEATVVATAIADDNSIFLMGDFNEVDGIPRPGLAKLTSKGHLDSSFEPRIGVEMDLQVRSDLPHTSTLSPLRDSPFNSSYDNGTLRSFESKARPLNFPEHDLFPLDEGRVFVRNQKAWTILNADGSPDYHAFPGFDRHQISALPQVLRGKQLIVLTEDDRLVALDLSKGDTVDPGFSLDPSWTGTILQAVPTVNNQLWILSQQDQSKEIFRLNNDGTLDPNFTPLPLLETSHCRIEPGTNGGFILTSVVPRPFIIFPRPTLEDGISIAFPCCGFHAWKNERKVEWFDANGAPLGSTQFEIGTANRPLILATPSQRVILFAPNPKTWHSQSAMGDATLLPDLPRATPNHASDLPLVFETADLFKNNPSETHASYLIGGTRLHHPDGNLDPTRHIARLTRQAINLKAKKQPDGSILVSGDFDHLGQWPCRGMIRLTPNGVIDQSFSPDLDLRFAQDFEINQEGRIFVHLSEPWIDPDGFSYSLVSLTNEGKVERGLLSGLAFPNITQIELLTDGSLLVESSSFSRNNRAWNVAPLLLLSTSLQRILPSGTPDEDWPPSRNLLFREGKKLLPLTDGSFIWGNAHYSKDGMLIQNISDDPYLIPLCQDHDGAVIFKSYRFNLNSPSQLYRWFGGPDLDPTFVSGLSPHNNHISGVKATTRGKLLVWGRPNTPAGPRTMVRLHSTGQLDYTFDPPSLHHQLHPASTPSILTHTGLEQSDPSRFSSRAIPDFIFSQGDSLFAGGSFGESEGSFIHLVDSHLTSYPDWITSATGGFHPPSGDFDQDGRTNLHEYALGTDPTRRDAFTPELERSSFSPLSFRLAVNPESPEVRRTLEVSSDLVNWVIGTPQHFTTENVPGFLNVRMTQSEHRLLLRTRYSLR